MAQLDSWDFEALSLEPHTLDEMKGSLEETHEIYAVDSREAPEVSLLFRTAELSLHKFS